MAKFISDEALNASLSKIFQEAEDMIVLISPFIKLHDRIKTVLKTKLGSPQISLIIVFGKNEDNVERSLNRSDFEFLKTFPNVEILYNSRLHAKYYASEKAAILTSMNLYDFSQNNNIEAGVLLKSSRLADIASGLLGGESLDVEAYNYFMRNVVDQSELVFRKVPHFKEGFLGLTSSYINSEVKVDESEKYFKGEKIDNMQPAVKRWKEQAAPVPVPQKPKGYCIRTGVSIPFNPQQPLSGDAYKSWSKFSNPDYRENFCHFSGEASNGKTSFSKPILRKNWNRAKEVHGL